MRIIVRDTPANAAAVAAEVITSELSVPGPASLGLAGGRTPAPTYRLLASSGIDWETVTLWLGDERWVSPEHHDSNTLLARSELGPAAAASLLVPDVGLGRPEIAAAAYAALLAGAFTRSGGVPGTVVLGLGADGHTASLFPETAALAVTDSLYVANHVSAIDEWRLTATLPLLTAARHAIFLVTGIAKAAVLAEILDGSARYPARLVAEGAAAVTWVLDAAAASRLKSPGSSQASPAAS